MTLRGEKMSKTRGNVVDPADAIAQFGVDGTRYLVLREIPYDRGGDMTEEGLVRRYNAELAHDLGNLVNRTVSMAGRYLDGSLPPLGEPGAVPADAELASAVANAVARYHAAMRGLHFDEALGAVMAVTSVANGYAESQAPWTLHRDGHAERLGQVLAVMAETCRLLAHLMAPFTPGSALSMLGQLGVEAPYDRRGEGGPGWDALLAWGGENDVAGARRTAQPVPLFPRTELPEAAT
jgi:methionyl-tRNA synthetase